MHSLHLRFVAAIILTALAVATRLLPHQPNFTAVGAVALAVGCYLGWRWAGVITVAAMLVSDIFLGFYALPVMLSVYGSLIAAGALGRWVARRKVQPVTVVGASLAGSVVFFLVTNWAVWQFTALYPKTAAGLFASYVAALPFFRNSLVGDFLYTAALFGAFELARQWRQSLPSWRMLSHRSVSR